MSRLATLVPLAPPRPAALLRLILSGLLLSGLLLSGLVSGAAGAAAQAPPPVESEDLTEPEPQAAQPGVNAPDAPSAGAPELLELERLAEESFAQEDLVTAVALYRQLADRHTDTDEKIRVMMIVAWLQHQQGRSGRALDTLTRVLTTRPDYRFRPELYSEDFAPIFYDAQKRALQTREAEASALVARGSALLRERNYEDARAQLTRAIEIWPDQARGIYNLALVDYYENRADEALDGFQKVLALASAKPELVDDPLEALALTNQALLYMERDQVNEASSALQQAVTLDPSNATAWLNLGVAHRRLGDTSRAAEAFRRAWELDKENVGAGRSLALAYLDSGDPAAADRLLDELTGTRPEDAGLWLYSGMAQKALGDPAGAVLALETAVTRDPENRGGWAGQAALQLAALHYAEADYHGVRRQAERVVRWLPEQTNGWVYLGLAQQALDRLEPAAESLENARRLAPTRADIHNSLGSVYFEMSHFDDAEASFRRALEIQPGLETARRNLDAVLTVKRGDAVASRRSPGRAPSRRAAPPRKPAPPPPAPQRPGLGIRFSKVDYASLGLQGVMVEQVFPDTAAARAGIQAEDLLLKMDGRPITGADAVRDYAASLPSGQTVVLELLRDNRPTTIRLAVP